ncbi:cytochrome P450 [Pendulispora albinea]|uniref:Cytochrome P450 n=1 Tax=Pendulispora albinea TaxID=2741071 RepID=A0ABZ2LL56_9BACT
MEPPFVRGDFLFGHARRLRSGPLELFEELVRDHPDLVQMRVGHLRAVLVSHPEGVARVLRDNQKNYSKETPGFHKVRLLLGRGLLTSYGELWLRQRRMMQPAFHREKIAAFAPAMTRAAHELGERWQGLAGRIIDVADEMMRLTLRVTGETLFGTDVSRHADAISEAVAVVLVEARRRVFTLFDFPLAVPTPNNLRLSRAIGTLDGIVRRTIAERRRGAPKDDLLGTLLAARDGEGEGASNGGARMSDEQIRDEVMTLLLAGHETTANALAWTFHCLAENPRSRELLEQELDHVLGGRPPTMEDVPRLQRTRMVVLESMRLYPPVWILPRLACRDDIVCGYRVRAGTIVLASPYATHRHPHYWERPEHHDPNRFTREREMGRSKFAYFPFGGGPRACIGSSFALVEIILALATLAQRFVLRSVPGHRAAPEPRVTVRPRDGLPMIVHSRQTTRAAGSGFVPNVFEEICSKREFR